MRSSRGSIAVSLLCLASCVGTVTGPDGGTGARGGADAGGTGDAGPPLDAGAGPPLDAGPNADAGTGADAGSTPDAGSSVDAGATPDAGSILFQDAGTYGVPVNGYPSWPERAVMVCVNAVRLDPGAYKAEYAADFTPPLGATVLGATYPAVAPLRWNDGLNQSSRFHSADMANHGCFMHNSCDNTNVFTRIMSYYALSGTLGENIAAGLADPRATVNLWLCDANAGACCADGTGCDGHRQNIMSANYAASGAGFAADAGSTYVNYWTQDFGGVADGAMPPLVDGTHLFFPANQLTFLANYAGASPASALTLVLDGASQAMTQDLGTSGSGSWKLVASPAASCRSYHFEATTQAGLHWRYPASGELRTWGEGSCAEDYVP